MGEGTHIELPIQSWHHSCTQTTHMNKWVVCISLPREHMAQLSLSHPMKTAKQQTVPAGKPYIWLIITKKVISMSGVLDHSIFITTIHPALHLSSSPFCFLPEILTASPHLSLGYIWAPWSDGSPLSLNSCSTYCFSPGEKSVTSINLLCVCGFFPGLFFFFLH